MVYLVWFRRSASLTRKYRSCAGRQRFGNLVNSSKQFQPRADFARRLGRFVRPAVCCATSISELSASLTARSVGNAAATSGLSSTRLVPARYAFRYFPRTPFPRSSRRYSGRSSSRLTFFIYFPLISCHQTRAEYRREDLGKG